MHDRCEGKVAVSMGKATKTMRPTLGNYFEVEPGSGIFFLSNSHFFDNFLC